MASKKRASSNTAASTVPKRPRKENADPADETAYSTRVAKATKPIEKTEPNIDIAEDISRTSSQ
ncbi:hypothetical protein FB645_005650, partial [Coemansia sp. IMI 203386]